MLYSRLIQFESTGRYTKMCTDPTSMQPVVCIFRQTHVCSIILTITK